MKALTICQPYAAAIIHGPKRVENRMNHWRFRGRVLVHAGKSRKFMGTLTTAELDTWPEYEERELVYGEIIGSVHVWACVPSYKRKDLPFDPWESGPYCLLLRNPLAFAKPIPFRGQLGLFDVPDDLIAHEIERIEAAITQK